MKVTCDSVRIKSEGGVKVTYGSEMRAADEWSALPYSNQW